MNGILYGWMNDDFVRWGGYVDIYILEMGF